VGLSAPDVSSGPVAVCLDRPVLALDRPFTYDLPAELGAGVGSLVRVRFHGKLTRGWVLGPTDDIPGRMLPVMRVVSPVRVFDESGLALARWVSERYVAPLAAVLDRLAPPRVAALEAAGPAPAAEALGGHVVDDVAGAGPGVFSGYVGGAELLEGIAHRSGSFVLRPAPDEETTTVVEAVRACLHTGNRALVIVPEAVPVPATAAALIDAFGPRVCVFAGGDKRARYETWLAIRSGAFDVVVGTRPAVFAPITGLGLIVVARESHPALREDRSPYYHVRDVARRRAAIEGAALVLSSLCPSAEVTALGLAEVAPRVRRWPKVEVVRPGAQGRAPRLVAALRGARRAFVFAPIPGHGLAKACRSCGAPASCASCGGALRSSEGAVLCVVCLTPGRCPACGQASFGIERGGAERVEEWVGLIAPVPVRRPARPRLPRASGEVLVGGPEVVHDLGPGGLDLVAVLDADLAERRPGLAARERALATWMEAVGWAWPDGRVIVQSTRPGEPAVQALVRGSPARFHVRDAARRAAAGFPVGMPVFRVIGDERLEAAVDGWDTHTALVSSLGGRTVCLLALEPEAVPAFGAAVRELAGSGVVERVEAEPHL